jgi:hypothetical protein
MVMGPFSRVDFWDRGAAKDLEVPFWARDVTGEGVDRTLDLPCFGAKLKGDYLTYACIAELAAGRATRPNTSAYAALSARSTQRGTIRVAGPVIN